MCMMKSTSAGQVAATISNLGLIGNSFGGSFNVEGFLLASTLSTAV